MVLAHSWRKPVLAFKPGRTEVVSTAAGNFPRSTKSIFIPFKPVFPGYPTTAIPTRFESKGRLLSHIDTKQEAERLSSKLKAQGFEAISEKKLIEWFRQHPAYGVEMIFVDDETTQAVGDEGFGDGITAVGDGGYVCTVCNNKPLSGKGLHFHTGSEAHLSNLAEARELQLEIA